MEKKELKHLRSETIKNIRFSHYKVKQRQSDERN